MPSNTNSNMVAPCTTSNYFKGLSNECDEQKSGGEDSPEFSMNDSIRKYKRKLEHEFPDHFIHKPSTKETEK